MSELSSNRSSSCTIFQVKGVTKKVLSAGNGPFPQFVNESKVLFHFRTEKLDGTVIDDTRKMCRPMEFILGKQFKLEVWESCVKTMHVNEVAEYTADKTLVATYPWVSKMVRTAFGKDAKNKQHNHEHQTSHCCGMMNLNKEGMGYPDLDDLVQYPQTLRFIIELLQVVHPGDYEKETWEMNDHEKLASLPKMKEEGNALYLAKKYEEASRKYAEALGRLEQLVIKEKPGDDEWQKLEQMKIPFLLNYSQCKLLEGDYYQVIEHTSTVLRQDPDNVKALFRRAHAHVGAWNPEEARKDYEKIKLLDASLTNTINKEIKNLDERIKQKNEEDKAKFMGKLF